MMSIINKLKYDLFCDILTTVYNLDTNRLDLYTIYYEDITDPNVKVKLDKRRNELLKVFGSRALRATMNHYYNSAQHPEVNVLRQLLKYYDYNMIYKLEYCGVVGDKKVYKSKYFIQKV